MVLNSILPGSDEVVDLVSKAFDLAQPGVSGTDQKLQAQADRIERLLGTLEGDLGYLIARVAKLESQPKEVERVLAVARTTDTRFQVAAQALSGQMKEIQTSLREIDRKIDRLLVIQDCVGRWSWISDEGETILHLLPDGTFTASSDFCVGTPPIVDTWKGTWYVKANRLVISQTHFWAKLWWSERFSTWIDSRIKEVTATRICLKDGTIFHQANS
jgi:hypothetical protein